MKVHIDFGYFCWQFVSVVQHNLDHEDDGVELAEVVDIDSDTEQPTRIGFANNG